MANNAAVIANSRTPYSVIIQASNGASAGDPAFSYTRTNLLAALREGPLKAALAKTPDWTVFNTITGPVGTDDAIRLTRIAGGLNAALTPPNTVTAVVFTADSLDFSVEADNEGPVACDLLIEMRWVHSNEQ